MPSGGSPIRVDTCARITSLAVEGEMSPSCDCGSCESPDYTVCHTLRGHRPFTLEEHRQKLLKIALLLLLLVVLTLFVLRLMLILLVLLIPLILFLYSYCSLKYLTL